MHNTPSSEYPEANSPTGSLSIGRITTGIKNLLGKLFDKVSGEEIDHVFALSGFDALKAYNYLLDRYPPPPPKPTTLVEQPSVSTQNIPMTQSTVSHQLPMQNQIMIDAMMMGQSMMNNSLMQHQFMSVGSQQIPQQFSPMQQPSNQPMYLMNDGMGRSFYIMMDPSQIPNNLMTVPVNNGMTNSMTNSTQPVTQTVTASTQTTPPNTSTAQTATNHVLIDKKKKCRDWDKCTQTSDQTHVEKFYHPCRNGANCKNIDNVVHQNRFVHPCKDGKQCKKNDEVHTIMFTHK